MLSSYTEICKFKISTKRTASEKPRPSDIHVLAAIIVTGYWSILLLGRLSLLFQRWLLLPLLL